MKTDEKIAIITRIDHTQHTVPSFFAPFNRFVVMKDLCMIIDCQVRFR